MKTSSACPVVHFDHHSAEFNADPHGAWLALQDTPVAWSEEYGGFWVVSDHQGNTDVLQNADVFTSTRFRPKAGLSIPSHADPNGEPVLPMEVDPPEHGPVRALLNSHLSPSAVRKMMPLIESWTTKCIDQVIESGEGDLLYDVAGPVPAFITMNWLGFPEEHIREVAETVHHFVGYPPGSPEFEKARAENDKIIPTLLETCAARRAEPRDDLISRLMTQTLNGEPVTDSVIARLSYILVLGGVDTTTSLTSSALVHLNQDRELRQRLIDNPELIESATEEFLRVYPPLASIGRVARQDSEYRGCPISSGDQVLVSRHAANFDDEVFDNPDEFRPDRFPNRHVSFGLGPHRCVGSHLARLMFQEIIRQVLTRIPDYELDESRVTPYPDRGVFAGWTALPARFTPGSRLG